MNKRNSVLAVLAVLGGISATPPALAVDDDSVNSWGRWGQLVAPAAGPEVQIQPAVLVTNQVSRDLRPEEASALGPTVLAPILQPVVALPTGLEDVTDRIIDEPIGVIQPTPAPPPPANFPPLLDVTDAGAGPVVTAPPSSAPPPPIGFPFGAVDQ